MTGDPASPRVLMSVANELEAGDIVTALTSYDIEAMTVGGFTSGFKAEAPGLVQILVRSSDLDRAKQALAEIQQDEGKIDWDEVDVGEPEE
jgi:hypothetical protein